MRKKNMDSRGNNDKLFQMSGGNNVRIDDDDDDDEGTPLTALGVAAPGSGGRDSSDADDGKRVSFNANVDVRRFETDEFEEDDDEGEEFVDAPPAPRERSRSSSRRRDDDSDDEEDIPPAKKGNWLERPLISVSVKVIDILSLVAALALVFNLHRVPYSHMIPDIHILVKILVAAIVIRMLLSVLSDVYTKTRKMIQDRKSKSSAKKDKRKKK